MAPKTLINLLFTHKCYVICLGDPFQLPPIDENEDNHLLDNPHIFLDQIMRQAEDSEIIQLSMKIRNQEPLESFDGQNVKILNKSELNEGMLLWADQVLVGTNKEREKMNGIIRNLLHRGPYPENGEKVICLKNYWDILSISGGDPLVNGTIGELVYPEEGIVTFPYYIKSPTHTFEVYNTIFMTPDNLYEDLQIDKNYILTGEKCCDWRVAYQLGKAKERLGDLVPKEFSYAYAITAHKAQGSEWDKILVLEESFPFVPIEHARWLYTAITRASDKVVVVKKS